MEGEEGWQETGRHKESLPLCGASDPPVGTTGPLPPAFISTLGLFLGNFVHFTKKAIRAGPGQATPRLDFPGSSHSLRLPGF